MHPPLAVWLCATHFPSLSLRFWSLGSLEGTFCGNRCCSSLCEEEVLALWKTLKGCVCGEWGVPLQTLYIFRATSPPPNLSSSQGPVSLKPLIFFSKV